MIGLVILSTAFTAIHLIEELVGEGGPLWAYFGRRVGIVIPDKLGFLLFTVGLGVVLPVISVVAYSAESYLSANIYGAETRWHLGPTQQWVLSLLFGLRIGDCIFSHWSLALLDYLRGLRQPNPGLVSTGLYLVEAIWIQGMLWACYLEIELLPALLGAAFFAAVLPTLRVFGPSLLTHKEYL